MIHITNKNIEQLEATAITLGNFDGLHQGHMKLLNAVNDCAKAEGLKSVVFSFSPHPASFFLKKEVYTVLSSDEKSWLLEQIGMDVFVEYPFDEDFVTLEPEEFVKEILVDKMKCEVVVIGEEYHFGKGRKGDSQVLAELGKKYGFQVLVIPHLKLNEEKISSTLIRESIVNKRFDDAEKQMSRPFFIKGVVATGKKIGRTLGFPTVNIIPERYKILPPNGVYITKTFYDNLYYDSITNIGTNPTVGGAFKTVETFISGFERTIYGEMVWIYFYKWLRDEKRFGSVDELKERIHLDVLEGERFFALKRGDT